MDLSKGKRVSAKEAAALPQALEGLDGVTDVSQFLLPPGIYFLYLGDQLQYIGQSLEPSARIIQHKKAGKRFDRVFFLPTHRDLLLSVESELIKRHRPPLNNLPDKRRPIHKDPEFDQRFEEMTERDLAPIRARLAAQAAADPQYKLFERRTKGVGK